MDGWETPFKTKSQPWNNSATCASFRLKFRKLLATHRVTRIVCFGLGDIARKALGTIVLPNNQGYRYREPEEDVKDLYNGIMQHAAAITMAE